MKNMKNKDLKKQVRVALLSNFNIKSLGDRLTAEAPKNDIVVSIYEGQYGQWKQELLGESLYEFNPDIIFILTDDFGLDNEISFEYHIKSEREVEDRVNVYMNEVYGLLVAAKKKTSAKIIFGNIPNCAPKILGIIENKYGFSLSKRIKEANLKLEEKYANDKQVLIFDFDGWLGQIGKNNFWYDKYYFLGDLRLNPKAFPQLANELASYLIPLSAKTKKCLVLDLDNTLWGGIIGEDGIGGIVLAPNGKGQAFYLFQKLILAFHKKGVILAINSKNNEADAMKVLREHPHMILKEEHFASIKINWNDKASNMKVIAEEINIGADSLVFVDDDATNRELIKTLMPEVVVLEIPKEPENFYKTLSEYKGFNSFEFTAEDLDRGKTYFAEKKRRDLKSQIVDIDSFLESLELKLRIRPVNKETLSRVSQMTQKTNQFNLTTRRYAEEDLAKMLKNGVKMWALEVEDRFGRYGVTGLAILNKDKIWTIDSFLLSCRILGKKIEFDFLAYILEEIKKKDPKGIVRGEYIATAKNDQVKDFYPKTGFLPVKKEKNIWEMELGKFKYKKSCFIKVLK